MSSHTKHSYSWIILLAFPLLGVVGMILVLMGGSGKSSSSQTALTTRPTPPPIKTTPVPTVTIIPVLDNLAPVNELATLDGETFTLADFTGKIVILNFWATWCPPCVEEMPTLQRFAESHPNIVVLAVTDPEDGQSLDDVKAFIEQYQLTDISFGLDEAGRLRLMFNGLNLPMTFVLDAQGYVRFRQIGAVTEDDLNYYLSELS
jgi:thiol-disulfide isomerase/thioredoxin